MGDGRDMQPSDDFWGGVGDAVGHSPGWMVIGALLVVGVLFVVAKYVYPGHKDIKMRELDIRERETQNDEDRIKANAALAENMRGLRESNDVLAQQNAALAAGIEESKVRSREMGESVSRIDATTSHAAEQIADIHRAIVRKEAE